MNQTPAEKGGDTCMLLPIERPSPSAHLLPRHMHVRANTSRVAQSVGRIRSLEDLPPPNDLLVAGANDSVEARTDGS